jgi:MFS family permease
MRRGILVAWHLATLVVAACLYFFFVVPRWPEFAGQTSHTLGTVLRIVTGVLVAQAAAPVVIDLVKRRRPEFGTPRLALALRAAAIIGLALAGLMIIGAAVAEMWLDIDNAGLILFGVYGAAAALTVLAAGAFYLAFAAESTPAPPKPLKPRKAAEPESDDRDAPGVTADAVEADQPVNNSVTETTVIADGTSEGTAMDRPTPRGRLRNRREPETSTAVVSKD